MKLNIFVLLISQIYKKQTANLLIQQQQTINKHNTNKQPGFAVRVRLID